MVILFQNKKLKWEKADSQNKFILEIRIFHTDLSMDAGAFGNRIGMDDAYQFARGDQVTSSSGIKAKLSRPLDFLVIADHSDGMAFFPDLRKKKSI